MRGALAIGADAYGVSGDAIGAISKGASSMFPAALVLGGLGAAGNIFGSYLQGNAQRASAQIQANAANNQALAGIYGQRMAMSQNSLDRSQAFTNTLYNIKAGQDARADNYRYGQNAFLTKTEGDIQQNIIAQAGQMRSMLAGKSMDALNSYIDAGNTMRAQDNAFANSSLLNAQNQQLAERAGKFRAFFENPMERAEMGARRRQEIGIALSPEARELSRREREGRIKEAVSIQRGVLDKMFGNYSPGFYG